MTSFMVSTLFKLEDVSAEDVAEFADNINNATRETFEMELKFRGVTEAVHPIKFIGTFITQGVK